MAKVAESGPYKGLTKKEIMGPKGAKIRARLRRERKSKTPEGMLDSVLGPRRLAQFFGASTRKGSPVYDRDELIKMAKPKRKPKVTELPDQGRIGTVQEEDARDKGSKSTAKVIELPDQGRIGTVFEETRRAADRKARKEGMSADLSDIGEFPTAKKASLKGAPRPELPKKSDPDYKTKLAKFRKWYTANRAKPKKKKVVLTKAAPVKTAPTKTAPKKVASSIQGLRARIAQKRKTGQRIPKAWLKAERMEDLNVINENLAEVERGKRDMAKWRKGRAETLAKHSKAKKVAESKSRIEAIKQRKADAQARLAKMKADQEAKKKKNMQATMSALPGFRSK